MADKTENLFWQIVWFQDEILKRCGDSWNGTCMHVRPIAMVV